MIATGFVGPTITLALGFTLGVIAAFSLVFLLVSSWMTEVSVEPSKVRTFKHENRPALLRFRAQGSRWAKLDSVALQTPFGLAGEVKQLAESSAELTLNPEYSGRFEGFRVRTNATDVLGLFLHQEEADLDLVVESLPRALLSEVRPVAVFPLIVGEFPAGRRGGGQEIYSIEEYRPSLDTRDILWKRVARATDGKIPVRVRESNIRKSFSIGVAVGWDSDDQRAKRMDLVSEAVAQIGVQLVLVHTDVEIRLLFEDNLFVARASTLPELADATVGVWTRAGEGNLMTLVRDSDMLIVGPKELAGDHGHLLSGTKPSVLVSEEPIPSKALRGAFVFTGKEDLSPVAAQVLQR